MDDATEERFQRIERNLEEASRMMAQTAAIGAETAKKIGAMTENLTAFISESREGRKTLEANMNAFLRALTGGKNGKT